MYIQQDVNYHPPNKVDSFLKSQYIGIDLHSNKFTCNFLRTDNKSMKESFLIHPIEFQHSFFPRLTEQDYVLIEASTNSFAFYDLIKDKVKEVIIANPMDLRIIYDSGKKTDKIDAEKLSRILRYCVEGDDKILNRVYVPEKEIRELRSLFTSYKLYKRQIASQKNRIHSILRQNLIVYSGDIFTNKIREEILSSDKLDEGYKKQIEILYESVEYLEDKAEQIKEEILYIGRKYKEQIDILTSIKGISVFVALGLIADYGEVERFKNAKKFSSYLRAVPKVEASNEKVYIGKTNKRGRKLSISLLLQALHHTMKDNVYLRDFYLKKINGKSVCKVRMAVVRKLLVAIYYMLKNKEYYKYRNEENHQRKMREYERFIRKYEQKKTS